MCESAFVCVILCGLLSRVLFMSPPSPGAAMLVLGCVLLALCSAAPPAHINRLALFPDKSAWCEAKNITQIVGHTGCMAQSMQNRSAALTWVTRY